MHIISREYNPYGGLSQNDEAGAQLAKPRGTATMTLIAILVALLLLIVALKGALRSEVKGWVT